MEKVMSYTWYAVVVALGFFFTLAVVGIERQVLVDVTQLLVVVTICVFIITAAVAPSINGNVLVVHLTALAVGSAVATNNIVGLISFPAIILLIVLAATLVARVEQLTRWKVILVYGIGMLSVFFPIWGYLLYSK
jgi:hypothetical protein